MALPKNICLAPFICNTINPQGNQSPCPTLGGDIWDFSNIPLKDRWMSPQVEDFRQTMLNDQRLPECSRCWNEEKTTGNSFRIRLYNPEKDSNGIDTQLLNTSITPATVIDKNFHSNGPMQLVMKVNNVCNLRCRSCNSMDSVTYKIEGQYYENTYNIKENMYTRGPDAIYWSDEQINEIFSFSRNLRRLELYGGEPLLDKQTPKLLKKLVESGLSKNIHLNISTNATIVPNDDWFDMVNEFEQFNLCLSIDGLGKHFNYIRHPGNWDSVTKNIDFFNSDARAKLKSYSVLPVITVSTLNIFYLPELFTEMRERCGATPFLNLVYNPWYYQINNIPGAIKQEIIKKFEQYNIPELKSQIKFMNSPMDIGSWEKFKFWTKAKDEYRGERFPDVFPEFYEKIKSIDPTFYT